MRIWRVPYPKFGTGPCLDRTATVAATLGIDLARFGERAAVVVGSNGKGSTGAMTAALLQQTHESVGLFTSPHMLSINERFRIGDEDITDAELEHHWQRVDRSIAQSGERERMGGFEFLFLIAADWFAARDCTYTVWEAGIGGRFDPVRLVEARRVALTALDFEHTALLGETLAEIARNKIDAAPQGARLYIGEACFGERAAIEGRCAERGVHLRISRLPPGALTSPLAGEHQLQNASLAIALATDIAALGAAEVSAGLMATHWPGRLEVLQKEPLIVIDVGHTPAGVSAALAGFNKLRGEGRAVLICGVSADKDIRSIVTMLAPAFDAVICTSAHYKGAPTAEIAALVQNANPGAEILLAEDVVESCRLASVRAGASGSVYVAGGLFLAAEFKAAHLGRDPAALVFF